MFPVALGIATIAMLAGNPLLLTLMAIINRHQELPRNRVSLYEKSAEVLLQQWDTERFLEEFPGLNLEIDLRAKKDILCKVSSFMQSGGKEGKAANIIDGDTLRDLIEEYLRDELNFEQARGAANALLQQLRHRNFILCDLGGNSYAFVHRTFLEYFCATDFVLRFQKEQSLSIETLIELFDQHCRDDDWSEVLRLICGQIDEQFVGLIVEHLVGRVDLDKWDGKVDLPELELAVWCLGEVLNPSKLAQAGELLWRRVIMLFEQSHQFNSTADLLSAAEELGTRWPGQIAPPEKMDWPGEDSLSQIYWPQLLAIVLEDRTLVASLITDELWTIRNGAIKALAKGWPDDETRHLLSEYALHGEDISLRSTILEQLAQVWPDGKTRRLLNERAVQDEYERPREEALNQLAMGWPDDETRNLIRERTFLDGSAATLHGKSHSYFGEILFTKDLDCFHPYLDPRTPLTREHIDNAAKEADINPNKIDETLASLSEHMGWDVTKGSGAPD